MDLQMTAIVEDVDCFVAEPIFNCFCFFLAI